MQSDLVVEAEAIIPSFPTKAMRRNNKCSSNNHYGQTMTKTSKSSLTFSSAKSESVNTRETTYSATDDSKGFNEIRSRANTNANPNPTQLQIGKNIGKNGIHISPTTLSSSSRRITHHSNSGSNKRGNEQSVEDEELMKTAILLPLKEEKMSENDIPFDQANDDLAIRENSWKSAISTKTPLHAGTINHHDTADYGNTRNPRVPDFKDSAYSPVATKFESVWLSSPERSSSQPRVSINSGDEMNNQFIRKTEVTDSENYDLVENGGQFLVPPPKYSDPYTIALDHEGLPLSTAFYKEQKYIRTISGLSLIPQHISEREKVITPSSTQQGENTNNEIGNDVGTNTRHDKRSDIDVHELGINDDDSIFNFPEKARLEKTMEQDRDEHSCEKVEIYVNRNVKVTNELRRRSKQRRKQRIHVETVCTDDEISTENHRVVTELHSTGLQERAHQAWKSRQRKNSTMRSKYDNESRSERISNVSFGASDTIHHFEPQVLNRQQYNNEDEEDISLDRSLNSEYTKTLESEVEDMIKDILFIGSPQKSKPGRRKYRYKPKVERKLCEDRISKAITDSVTQIDESDRLSVLHETMTEKVENGPSLATTLPFNTMNNKCESTNASKNCMPKKNHLSRSRYQKQTCVDDRCSLASTISRGSSVGSNTVETFQSEKDTIEDPLNTVIGFVEGGLSVMTSAIGYALGTEDQENGIDECQKVTSDYDIFESCGIHIGDQKVVTKSNDQIVTRATDVLSKNGWVDRAGGVDHIGPKNASFRSKKAKRKSEIFKHQKYEKILTIDRKNESGRHTSNLGKGSELIRLAIHAARSVHKLQGVEYDESVTIDMNKEVKKCHVTLGLPLGIIFLENDGGCFVTKVSPDGSAARSRRVDVGDQLASINGTSSIKMKVDNICDAISRSSDPSQIKLVFLRYTGPFRPSTRTIQSEHASEKIDDIADSKDRTSKISRTKKLMKKKAGFRLFGKIKKNSTKKDEKGTAGEVP